MDNDLIKQLQEEDLFPSAESEEVVQRKTVADQLRQEEQAERERHFPRPKILSFDQFEILKDITADEYANRMEDNHDWESLRELYLHGVKGIMYWTEQEMVDHWYDRYSEQEEWYDQNPEWSGPLQWNEFVQFLEKVYRSEQQGRRDF
jgi:hypothetical protein